MIRGEENRISSKLLHPLLFRSPYPSSTLSLTRLDFFISIPEPIIPFANGSEELQYIWTIRLTLSISSMTRKLHSSSLL